MTRKVFIALKTEMRDRSAADPAHVGYVVSLVNQDGSKAPIVSALSTETTREFDAVPPGNYTVTILNMAADNSVIGTPITGVLDVPASTSVGQVQYAHAFGFEALIK